MGKSKSVPLWLLDWDSMYLAYLLLKGLWPVNIDI